MRPGRVKESVLKRSVLRQLHTKKPSGSPAHGEVSVISTEGWTLAAQRTVYGAVNHLAAAGAAPESVALTILMPEHTEEPRLKELTRQIDACCVQTGIYCAAVYAAASPCVKDLVISATGIGLSGKAEPASAPQRFRGSRLPAGLDLVAVGSVGREGTAMLACEREEALLTRYPSFFIAEAKQMFDDGDMTGAVRIAGTCGAVSVRAAGEGGIFAALWEMAAVGHTGLDVELKRIPIRQHTVEVCEFFRLNPYMLRSGGTLLMAGENGERLVSALRREGYDAAVIGRTTDNNDKIVRYDDEIRYLEPPKEDAYYAVHGLKADADL